MAKGETAAIPSTEQHGVVVKWDAEKGYGFIRPDGAKGTADQDVFVHVRNVEGRRDLTPGQGASYHLTRTDKGLAAINVRPGSVLGTPYLKFTIDRHRLGAAAVAGVRGRPAPIGVAGALAGAVGRRVEHRRVRRLRLRQGPGAAGRRPRAGSRPLAARGPGRIARRVHRDAGLPPQDQQDLVSDRVLGDRGGAGGADRASAVAGLAEVDGILTVGMVRRPAHSAGFDVPGALIMVHPPTEEQLAIINHPMGKHRACYWPSRAPARRLPWSAAFTILFKILDRIPAASGSSCSISWRVRTSSASSTGSCQRQSSQRVTTFHSLAFSMRQDSAETGAHGPI